MQSLQYGPACASTAPQQCWPHEELLSRSQEAQIQKGFEAFRPPPADKPILSSPIKDKMKGGAIRRVNLPEEKNFIALTFDLCEQPDEIAGYDGKIVDILREQKVPATFFAGGKWLLTHEKRAKQLMTDPLFEIGNHAWEHRNLRLLSGLALRQEIEAPQAAFERLESKLTKRVCTPGEEKAEQLSTRPMRLFRFPFGACTAEALKAVNEAGLIAIQWDISSGDPSKGVSAAQMTSSVLKRAKRGSIILFHANGRGWHTAEALGAIIRGLRERGFVFVKVSDLIDDEDAELDIRKDCFDEKPGDTNRYDELARRLEAKFQAFQATVRRGFGGAAPNAASGNAETATGQQEAGVQVRPSADASEGSPKMDVSRISNKARNRAALRALAPSPEGGEDRVAKLAGLFDRGLAQLAQEKLDDALNDFQLCRVTAEELAHSERGNARWLVELAFCQGGIGDALHLKSDPPGAESAYDYQNRILSRLTSLNPNNALWQRALAISYAWLASSYWDIGDAEKALSALISGKAALENALKQDPGNFLWRGELAWFKGELIHIGGPPQK